jgi:hypothetical protein
MATHSEVTKSIQDILNKCADILNKKGKHYAGTDADRLLNFKVANEIFSAGYRQVNNTPKRVLWGYLLKHLTSICYMCHMKSENAPSREDWDEKIVDSINYLLLLSAMVDEEIREEEFLGRGPREDSQEFAVRQDKYIPERYEPSLDKKHPWFTGRERSIEDQALAHAKKLHDVPLRTRRAHTRLVELMEDEA